jgi:osmotically-inducible protein OsmY
MAYRDRDDFRGTTFDSDRREGRRHGDPYDDVFSRSLRDGRGRYARSSRVAADRDYRFPEDEVAGRRWYGSSWSDGSAAYGGQKGGLSAGYGRRESGLRRESAAVPGAFGGRRDPDRPDMRGRGPKGYTRSDERIREAVCDALTDDPVLDASDIEVSVAQGEVTLSGTVPERTAKRHAEDLVEEVSGIRHVQNNLRVKEGEQP